jgi:hypothetical protein
MSFLERIPGETQTVFARRFWKKMTSNTEFINATQAVMDALERDPPTSPSTPGQMVDLVLPPAFVVEEVVVVSDSEPEMTQCKRPREDDWKNGKMIWKPEEELVIRRRYASVMEMLEHAPGDVVFAPDGVFTDARVVQEVWNGMSWEENFRFNVRNTRVVNNGPPDLVESHP